jgi:GNAT superfamily N-acetyltransferase
VSLDVTYTVHSLSEVAQDLLPMFQRSWEESTDPQDQNEFSPDWDRYFELERLGAVYVIVARRAEEILGYTLTLAIGAMHSRNQRLAFVDTFYLSPEHRRGRLGIQLIKETEKAAKAAGLSKIAFQCGEYFDAKVSGFLSKLFYWLKYRKNAIIVSKNL